LQHPVQHAEQVNDALFVPVALIQQLGEPPFCRIALRVVALGLSSQPMGGSDQGEGVGVGEQRFQVLA
jgi:hypothetical protein